MHREAWHLVKMLSTVTGISLLLAIVTTTTAFSKLSTTSSIKIWSRVNSMSSNFKKPLPLISSLAAATQTLEKSDATLSLPLSSHSKNNDKNLKYDWSFIESAFLITCPNGDPGSVRLNQSKDFLAQVNLLDKVQIREFETDDEDRIRGCYTSHMVVLREASDVVLAEGGGKAQEQQQGWWENLFVKRDSKSNSKTNADPLEPSQKPKLFLVLEDNIALTGKLSPDLLTSLETFIDDNKDTFDMIHLSYTPFVPNFTVQRTKYNQIVQLSCGEGSALGTTAYIVSERGIQALLDENERTDGYNGTPIPDVMSKVFQDTRFATFPTPFIRAFQTKSLVNPQLDTLRQILFQPSIYSVFESTLVYTGQKSNTLLPVAVLVLLLTTVWALLTSFDAISQIVQNGVYNGNILVPLISVIFSLSSLGILAVGAALAPKPQGNQNSSKNNMDRGERNFIHSL